MSEKTGISDFKFGIIGFGNFGKFLYGLLPGESKKLIYDTNISTKVEAETSNSIEELADAVDILFLAIPLKSYEDVLPKLSQTSALIVDVSSVKVKPTKLIGEYIPERETLITHPQFGPESAASGLNGLKLVVTKMDGKRAEMLLSYFESLGIEVVHKTADEHDRQMAYTHALTFFISRALLKMELKDVELSAPSFKKLLALEELETHHSQALFDTIQKGNPYAEDVRHKFMSVLQSIEDTINGQNN